MRSHAHATNEDDGSLHCCPDLPRHDRAHRLRPVWPARPAGGLSCDDVVLCASELATNAVRHSRSGLRGGTFTVRVTVAHGVSVRVDVEDDGGPWAPALADPDRHHGLDIVGAVASELAIAGDDHGRTVSAVLSWTPQPHYRSPVVPRAVRRCYSDHSG